MTTLSEHEAYDLGMLQWASDELTRIGPEPPTQANDEILQRNVLEECFLLHAYNLERHLTTWQSKVIDAAENHLISLTVRRLDPSPVDVSRDHAAIRQEIEASLATGA